MHVDPHGSEPSGHLWRQLRCSELHTSRQVAASAGFGITAIAPSKIARNAKRDNTFLYASISGFSFCHSVPTFSCDKRGRWPVLWKSVATSFFAISEGDVAEQIAAYFSWRAISNAGIKIAHTLLHAGFSSCRFSHYHHAGD